MDLEKNQRECKREAYGYAEAGLRLEKAGDYRGAAGEYRRAAIRYRRARAEWLAVLHLYSMKRALRLARQDRQDGEG